MLFVEALSRRSLVNLSLDPFSIVPILSVRGLLEEHYGGVSLERWIHKYRSLLLCQKSHGNGRRILDPSMLTMVSVDS